MHRHEAKCAFRGGIGGGGAGAGGGGHSGGGAGYSGGGGSFGGGGHSGSVNGAAYARSSDDNDRRRDWNNNGWGK